MPYEGPGPYYPFTTTGQTASDRKLQNTAPTTTNSGTTVNFGTNTAARYIKVTPGGANSTSATPAAAQGGGYNILVVDMDSALGKRRIPAGDWTFDLRLAGGSADLAPPANTYGIRVYIHIRSSSGVLSSVAMDEGFVSSYNNATTARVLFTVTVPEIVLNSGETIHCEFWVKARGIAITGQNLSFHLGDSRPAGGPNITQITLPGSGIRYILDRGTVDSAPASDSQDEFSTHPRGATETVSALDAISRALVLGRDIDDVLVTSESAGRLLLLPRSVSDTTEVTDTVIREQALGRGLTDQIAATDTFSAAFTGGRTVSESLTQADAVNRSLVMTRMFSDSVDALDAATKQIHFTRTLLEAYPTLDSISRNLVVTREVPEDVVSGEVVDRVLTYVREATENLASSGGTERAYPQIVLVRGRVYVLISKPNIYG